jgi:D-cysteine desulfhydrase
MAEPIVEASVLPLLERFPALARIPRVALTTLPTPIERVASANRPDGATPRMSGTASLDGEIPAPANLWIKRDDHSATALGGNKVRALEFLLGRVRPGDTVLTVGGEGSTHVLATAFHAGRIGARTIGIRWRHEMNPEAIAAARESERVCALVTTSRTVVGAMVRVAWLRARDRRLHWIPIGGSTPLGILGHVNAALELEAQVAGGLMPRPARLVVPLGSGGTAAGLALGLAIAGASTVVVGARVGPRVVANRRRVRHLATATARLIESVTGERLSPIGRVSVEVVHDVYGGAYGRPLPAGDRAAARLMDWRAVRLDATYSAKALAAAMTIADHTEGPTLFWLTFDGRLRPALP